MKKFVAFSAILSLFISCGKGDKGELVGVKGRKWHPEKPYGMTLIPEELLLWVKPMMI